MTHWRPPGTRVLLDDHGIYATVVRCYDMLAYTQTDDGTLVCVHVWHTTTLTGDVRPQPPEGQTIP